MNRLIPPLRLIVNSACNGCCSYCHREGNVSEKEMHINVVRECARIAKRLSIPSISISGGEPTLRNDLDEVINVIYSEAPKSKISITTNGCNLSSFLYNISAPVYKLNLSISSFNASIAEKYQNVDPQEALSSFRKFPAIYKNLNIVITEDNYIEIPEIIKFCIDNSIALDLMFELKKYNQQDKEMQKFIFNTIEPLGDASIVLANTPKLLINVNNDMKISVKHPFLSALNNSEMCNKCHLKTECFERICAIRVTPDATVSPCLNNKVVSCGESLSEKINSIYQAVLSGNSSLSFIYRGF